MYNDQKNQIQKLENQIEEKDVKIKVLESEYQACKGEIFHKNKLLEMEKRKTNKASVDTISLD